MLQLSDEQISEILKNVLPDLKKISEAPMAGQITNFEAERERRYKSCTRSGEIYIIANPAAWVRTDKKGEQGTRFRPAPVKYEGASAIAPKKQKQIEERF